MSWLIALAVIFALERAARFAFRFDRIKRTAAQLFAHVVLAISNWPRRVWPTIPWFSEHVALPFGWLELGEEFAPPGEREQIDKLIEVLKTRHCRTYPSGVRPMQRDFHTKAHGCIAACFTIECDLPAEYRFGVFAEEKSYTAVVRYSDGFGGVESDRLPSPRGMAIKLFGVADPETGKERTVDFLLANYPVNMIGTVTQAYDFFTINAADKPLAYFNSFLPPKFHWRTFALAILSSPPDVPDVLDLAYWSQTPYRLGARQACKYKVAPTSCTPPVKPGSRREYTPDYLRDQLTDRLAQQSVKVKFYVQRQLDPKRQPVENATVEWNERESQPYHVATIELFSMHAAQADAASPFNAPAKLWCCERLKFNPDNALAANAPLGGVNRLRRQVYAAMSELRHRANGVHHREPANLQDYGDTSSSGWDE